MTMILNVSKQEVIALLDVISNASFPLEINHLKEKLRRLKTASEPVKSTIEQVRTAE